MYPQTVVPSDDDLHTTLTNGMDAPDSGVTLVSGVHYTANKDNIGWNPSNLGATQELNPVYEHNDKRYVRATPWSYETNATTYRYNYSDAENPDYIGRDGYRWFEVEPIKWIILNINGSESEIDAQGIVTNLSLFGSSDGATLELYAADVLMGGIPFNHASADPYRTVWDQSSIYKYLNEIFYKEAFPMTDIPISTIYNNNGDGTELNTAAYGLNSNHLESGGMNPTDQKIYPLSYYELTSPDSPYVVNGIFAATTGTSTTRKISGTDYARAHNVRINSSYALYWTRTAHSNGTSIFRVNETGSLGDGGNSATAANYGTRPALTMVCFAL